MVRQFKLKRGRLGWLRLLVLAGICWTICQKQVDAATWVKGDVFAGLADGSYNVYSNAGVFKENVKTGITGGFATGCAFNGAQDKLFTTNFSNTKVVVLSAADPHPVLQTIDDLANPGGGVDSESITFSTNGNFFVGHADGTGAIYKYDGTGAFLQSYAVAKGPRGSDFVDLSSDQTTMFYTSEGGTVYRFNVSGAGSQLTAFTTSLGGPCYGHRNLPPGDGSGGVLVACTSSLVRLNSSGAVAQTYTIPGTSVLFAMNLDPNGTSFWAADLNAGTIFRVNIATGAVELGPISAGQVVGGLCLLGEITGSTPVGGGGCPPHTVHGHITTVPPTHLGGIHVHHGQHGHTVAGCFPPHHPPFHLTAEPEENLFNPIGAEPEAVARGAVVQLFVPAEGLFLGEDDNQPALEMTAPADQPVYYTTSLPEVRVAGRAAQVLFSGLAPGRKGVWQIDVVVPKDAPMGLLPVTVNYEGDELKSVDISVR